MIRTLFSPTVWKDRFQRWSERARGVDFSLVVLPEEVGLDPKRSVSHVASGNKWLRRALADLPITPADRIIDVGCGKASAMKVMLDFPFARVDGVEAADAIAQVARANFRKLGIAPERYRIVTADATEFTALDEYSYVYMYNPFSCEVMASFMSNLAASVERAPRRVTILYDNPLCHDTIVGGGVFKKTDRDYPDAWGNRIYVYTNR